MQEYVNISRNILRVFSISFFLFVASSLPRVEAVSADFSDINGVPQRTSIEYVAAKGLVQGYSDGTFRPLQAVNRAELLTILIKSKSPAISLKDQHDCFRDVKTEWFAPYICAAKAQGIVGGYPNGLFRPGQTVNMTEAYTMALKTFAFPLPAVQKSDPWYRPFVDFVHNNNIFSKFAVLPSKEMTRAEMAVLLEQLLLIKEKQKPLLTKRENISPGCGNAPPKSAPTSSTINGVIRSYITVIPENYDENKPLKLVFAFHGRTNSNAEVQRYYGIERPAAGQAIFIYPAGLKSGSGYTWNVPADYAVFDQLLQEFSRKYCIDQDAIYAVGHSLGAVFVNSLACARGDIIRAIGTVGGGTSAKNCTGPVAAIIMHNPKDNLVPFSQGVRARDQFIQQNKCGTSTIPVAPQGLSCESYQGCGDAAPLTWCPHHEDYAYWDGSYYPHTWPRTAGQEIWKFFTALD